jgi:hypothetical protein
LLLSTYKLERRIKPNTTGFPSFYNGSS